MNSKNIGDSDNLLNLCQKSKIMETINQTRKIINKLITNLHDTNKSTENLENKLMEENSKISTLSFNLFDKNMLKTYNDDEQIYFYQDDVDIYFDYLTKIHNKIKDELEIRQKRNVDIQLMLKEMKDIRNDLLNLASGKY